MTGREKEELAREGPRSGTFEARRLGTLVALVRFPSVLVPCAVENPPNSDLNVFVLPPMPAFVTVVVLLADSQRRPIVCLCVRQRD